MRHRFSATVLLLSSVLHAQVIQAPITGIPNAVTRFDAAADRLLLSSGLFDWNSVYTWMTWVRFSSVATAGVFSANRNEATSDNMDAVYTSSVGLMTVEANNAAVYGGVGGTTTAVVYRWYHVSMVRESVTALRLYVNGRLEATDTNDVTGRAAATRVEMGGSTTSNNEQLNGWVVCTKIFTRIMRSAEIMEEMRQCFPIRTAQLYAYYPIGNQQQIDFGAAKRTRTIGGTLNTQAVDLPYVLLDTQAPHLLWVSVSGAPATPARRRVINLVEAPVVDRQEGRINVGGQR